MKKTNVFTLFILITLLFGTTQLFAKTHNNMYIPNYHTDQDLDLNAVSSIFGDSRDLYDFERRINDPHYKISNLDLNQDGYVDYLRVVETVEGRFHFIVIQAVIGKRRYQDIATIEVYKDHHESYVQVIGNTYIYGPNYVIEPIFAYRPEILTLFWQPRYYRPYYSQYRWRQYPSYYRPWRPMTVPYYRRHIRKHISHHNRYRQIHHKKVRASRRIKHKMGRNDYARKYPKRSYTHRKSHTPHMKKRDRKKIYKQKERTKKRTHKSVKRSTVPRSKTYNMVKSPVKKRAIKSKRPSRKDIKTRKRSTDRYIKRQNIQQRSLVRGQRH